MTPLATLPTADPRLPDDTELPDRDGAIVENDQEISQHELLTDPIYPVLRVLFPDERFWIGHNVGIYWRLPKNHQKASKKKLLRGAIVPDWFHAPGMTRMRNGRIRRSFVLWQETVRPLLIMEFVSGTGAEERDRTPHSGKMWIYEQRVQALYYAIYEEERASVEVYHLVDGRYELLDANDRQHVFIPEMAAELGIWQGRYRAIEASWLRWWDAQGNLLPTSEERAEQERFDKIQAQQHAEQERQEKILAQQHVEQERQEKILAQQHVEQERQEKILARQRAERMAAQLRAMGIEPDV